MKRSGMVVAALLVIAGVLRVGGSGVSNSALQGLEAAGKSSTLKTAKLERKSVYLDELAAKIQQSYGVTPGDNPALTGDLSAHLNVPSVYEGVSQRDQLRFVIAILPDPLHTHLGLFFDRSVEAIQQAAQQKGYLFDRAILPWDRAPIPASDDFDSRRREAGERAAKEVYPGLLIFRPGLSLRGVRAADEKENNPPPGALPPYGVPLFVFVVGETPTGGVNKVQFRNAVQLIRKIRAGAEPADSTQKAPVLILGPSFSGSLESLHQALHDTAEGQALGEIFVYSGTVTDAASMHLFERELSSTGHFASFQENDEYLLAQFLRFVGTQNYEPSEIAVLSEDETAYGHHPGLQIGNSLASQAAGRAQSDVPSAALPTSQSSSSDGPNSNTSDTPEAGLLLLHFPREISYFRSAYQKAAESQQQTTPVPQKSTLTLDLGLEESGSNGDSVSPYAGTLTALSQESVMLGIVNELQKHDIKFTVLFATDPVDELFLARYLRSAYPQGRVVITSPDLLFAREEDPLLRGVLGINSYALVPGLRDQLCRLKDQGEEHDERLFVSSLSVSTFNAMVGLLSVTKGQSGEYVPSAPYEQYGAPLRKDSSGRVACSQQPLAWLTILGRNGFWPVAGFRAADLHKPPETSSASSVATANAQVVDTLKRAGDQTPEALSAKSSDEISARTPAAWSIAYCLFVLLMLVHAILSWTGSILAESEERARFGRTSDFRHSCIVALGALALSTALVVLLCARSPLVAWDGSAILTPVLWSPLLLFAAATTWDLGRLRGHKPVALSFLVVLGVVTAGFLLSAFDLFPGTHHYWPTRLVNLASGASPVLPGLLLSGAGYWWMWQSLRGVTLIDLRRPRLPERDDLHIDAYHVDDSMGDQLRKTAHPFLFASQVLIPLIGLFAVSLTVVDGDHPVQTIEGMPYDLAYSALLGFLIATFLGCLLKLVWTWFKCRQVLAGLDRLPLRESFSRMKGLSWRSLWNPGGSTLRETYKLMSRALENLGRLDLVLEEGDPSAPLHEENRRKAREEIRNTEKSRESLHNLYGLIVQPEHSAGTGETFAAPPQGGAPSDSPGEISAWIARRKREAEKMPELLAAVETLQKQMAKTAAVVMSEILKPYWADDRVPVVSEDAAAAKEELPPSRVLAEEYAALIYVNFLASVLLRMRTLVICAGGMYVFIVLSVNTYPFEPHSALQTLAVLLLLVMGAVVGYVYAEMHREAILSRLTSTEVGELGLDFWLKFASAGAIPVLSLLAAQFPGISQFLFSWLEPALQAIK